MIKIILMAAIALNPIEVKTFLDSKGMHKGVELLDLSERKLGNQKPYFYKAYEALIWKAKHTVLITDPFIDDSGKLYTLGNTLKGFSHVACVEYNQNGESRRLHCLTALAHEIGHQFGLKHTTSCTTIMDVDALACPNIESLGFTKEQLKHLKEK